MTVSSFIEPVAPFSVWNVTLNSIGFQMAFITLSPSTVISSPGLLIPGPSPITHPENSWFSFGGLKVLFSGNLYFSPVFFIVTLSSPSPPFGTRVTL